MSDLPEAEYKDMKTNSDIYLIEARDEKNGHWISGIFDNLATAETYLLSIPEADRVKQKLLKLPFTSYPFFVIEDHDFEYGDVNFIKAKLKSLTPQGDEDYVHINIFAICADFSPPQPGTDSMGCLPHWHISDKELLLPRSDVFIERLRRLSK